jgi:Leucine-rich repeat (LRR) protein
MWVISSPIPTVLTHRKRIENFTKKIRLMKIVIFTLILGFFALKLTAQNGNCAKEHYDTYLKDAEKALKGAKPDYAKPDYLAAVNAYSSALAVCPDNAKFVKGKLREIFVEIDKLRVKAEEAEKVIKTALVGVEKQKQLATENLAKANKLVNAFYFYKDRFALALKKEISSGKNKFYFIDKNGDEVTKLGKWDKAEQFEWETDFAAVKKDGKNYILDTLGNTYRVAYDLATMDSSVVALDLSDVQLDSFPTPVLQYTQLQVLILNHFYNRKRKSLRTLPSEIAKLKNLKTLQLTYCNLDSLPIQIGELKNLTTLDLVGNKLQSLPIQIGELKNLTELYLRDNKLQSLPVQIGKLKNLIALYLIFNPIPKEEQEKIRKLLPNCEIKF